MRFYAGPTLLVIDELGYLPLPAEAASALFQVVSQRYLKTSIVITTNRPVGSWGDILGDTTVAAAMLDRLLHRSVVINLDGDSYRLRDHHARCQDFAGSPPASANHYADQCLRVGNFDEHNRGSSLSAVTRRVIATLSAKGVEATVSATRASATRSGKSPCRPPPTRSPCSGTRRRPICTRPAGSSCSVSADPAARSPVRAALAWFDTEFGPLIADPGGGRVDAPGAGAPCVGN